jgi:enoyl-CoA hydratase
VKALKTTTENIYLEKKESIATIYLNRPEKRNAMNYEMWCKLPELLQEVDSDPKLKVLVLRGVNEVAFCAGADISEFKKIRSNSETSRLYDQATFRAFDTLSNMKKPTIALIQGYCVGGGAGLALACDLRFSDHDGRFGITPSKLGLVYSTAATKRIVDIAGASRALDILMSGRIMDVQEAFHIGFVDRIIDSDKIEMETYEYVNLIASRAQYTVRAAKRIVREILNGATDSSEEIQQLIEDAYDTDDYKEGVQAFMEKRKPNFRYS